MKNNIIGRKIEMARFWRGLTICGLAKEVDIPVIEIMDFLDGTKAPDSQTLIAISKVLGVSIDWLMTDLDETDKLMKDGLKYRKMIAANNDSTT